MPSKKRAVSKPQTLPFKPQSFAPRIYELLMNEIVTGKLREGERIVESELAKAYGISRPPVREALMMLELDGLIKLIPYKGFEVTTITGRDARESLEMKGLIEGYAARACALRKETELVDRIGRVLDTMERRVADGNLQGILEENFNFHLLIVKSARNEKLLRFYESLTISIRRFYAVGLTKERSWKSSLIEHRRVLDAIRAGDPELAEKAARRHASCTIGRVTEQLKEREGDDVAAPAIDALGECQ
jgi:DNA-binding GntR family transcriptional regulator